MKDNRFNIPVLPVRCLSDGVTQEVRSAGEWLCRSKLVGGSRRQIRGGNAEKGQDAESTDEVD